MKTVKNGAGLLNELFKASNLLSSDIEEILMKLTMDAYKELVDRSPTQTGFLRSNWSIVVDSYPADKELENPHKEENSVPAPHFPNISVKDDSLVTIFNNTEYAAYIENGTHKRKAQPMVAPTLLMIEKQLRDLTRILSKRAYDV